MGELSEYICTKCGYRKEFRYGRGFLTDDKFEKEKILSENLKTDIKNGLYG